MRTGDGYKGKKLKQGVSKRCKEGTTNPMAAVGVAGVCIPCRILVHVVEVIGWADGVS